MPGNLFYPPQPQPQPAFGGSGAPGSWGLTAGPPPQGIWDRAVQGLLSGVTGGVAGALFPATTVLSNPALMHTASLPGRAIRGEVNVYPGMTSPETIEQAADFGTLAMTGGIGVPPVGTELGMGIRAYHGSPHSFEQFELSPRTIGTGEGAQMYGHGLYFAEKEGVGKSYRDMLAPKNTKWMSGDRELTGAEQNAANLLEHWGGDKHKALMDIKYSLRPGRMADQKYLDDTEAAIHQLDPASIKVVQDPGHMYEVDIAAEPEQFLDWDKPLSEQPEAWSRLTGKTEDELVAIDKRFEQLAQQVIDAKPGMPGYKKLMEQWDNAWRDSTRTGEDVYRSLTSETYPIRAAKDQPWGAGGKTYEESLAMVGGDPSRVLRLRNPMPPEGRSEALKQAGIPGIKYLDQGSRGLPDKAVLQQKVADYEQALSQAAPDMKPIYQDVLDGFRDKLARAEHATSNYVVFDDKLISILRKYGMGGMVGTAAGMEMANKLLNAEQAGQTL